jgi:predicted amidohydrolase
MHIAAAQIKPVKGDIDKNIANHILLIKEAVANKADAIFFPELSITGYEPELAENLATTAADSRFAVFQQLANDHDITIGIGLPVKNNYGIQISMAVYQPNKLSQTYAKQYLHSSETPWFVNGSGQIFLSIKDTVVAPAICYELNVPEHSAFAINNGASVYIACTVNSFSGIDKDLSQMAAIAANYRIPVLMSNCIGITGGYNCAGKTSAWNTAGNLIAQLDSEHEGLLIMDTATQQTTKYSAPLN